MNLKLDAACAWHMGLVRKKNEDNFLFFGEFLDDKLRDGEGLLEREKDWKIGTFLGVFDGVAGMPHGEEASRAAARALQSAPEKGLLESVSGYLYKISNLLNSHVIRRGKQLQEQQICSTVAGLYFGRKRLWGFNVGDSRCYLLRDDQLQQLSRDHTDAQSLRSRGMENHRPKLIQFLGTESEMVQVEPFLFSCGQGKGEVLLLCSDGLSDLVADEQIAGVLRAEESAGWKARRLVEKALEAGGKDNTTVIVLQENTQKQRE